MEYEEEMREREHELIRQIEALKREYMERAEPLAKELWDLRSCRGPAPIFTPEGNCFVYTGPRPKWTPDGIAYPPVEKMI